MLVTMSFRSGLQEKIEKTKQLRFRIKQNNNHQGKELVKYKRVRTRNIRDLSKANAYA